MIAVGDRCGNDPGSGTVGTRMRPYPNIPVWSNPMKFRPLHDRVVVRRITPLEKSAGGIIIPDTVQEKPMEGESNAAGAGARRQQGAIVALTVQTGERDFLAKVSCSEIKLDGEELLIMKESDLL